MEWKCEDCQKCFKFSKFGPKRQTSICGNCHQKRWRLSHEQHLKSYRLSNKEQIYSKAKEWFSLNKEKRREYKRLYYRKRKASDPQFKIKANLRSRLADAVKGKGKSTETLLGCSYVDFLNYLVTKFYNHPVTGQNMTLKNYGEWHIDHIKPLSQFDLLDPIQLQQACHYSNLQPLWYIDHVKKTSSDLK